MSTDQITFLQSEPSAPLGQPAAALGLEPDETARIPDELSIMPIRGFVAFPGTILPLTVTRPESIKLLDETLPRTKVIGLAHGTRRIKGEPRTE